MMCGHGVPLKSWALERAGGQAGCRLRKAGHPIVSQNTHLTQFGQWSVEVAVIPQEGGAASVSGWNTAATSPVLSAGRCCASLVAAITAIMHGAAAALPTHCQVC